MKSSFGKLSVERDRMFSKSRFYSVPGYSIPQETTIKTSPLRTAMCHSNVSLSKALCLRDDVFMDASQITATLS